MVGEPKMSDAPNATCRPFPKALVKRVSRSETSASGSPTSWNTDATKLRTAVLAVAVLKVGTSHTRPVRRSMRTCRKSWPERADAPSSSRGDRQAEPQAGRWQVVSLDALTRRASVFVLAAAGRQAGPPHRAARQGEYLVLTDVPAEQRRVELVQHLPAQCPRRRHAKAIAAPQTARRTGRRTWGAGGGLPRRAPAPVPPSPGALEPGQAGVPRESRTPSWRAGSGVTRQRDQRPQGGGGVRDGRSEELNTESCSSKPVCDTGPGPSVKRFHVNKSAELVRSVVSGQQVELARLMMTGVAVRLQPLQAGVVGVELEGLFE